jgi:hypothetical protein
VSRRPGAGMLRVSQPAKWRHQRPEPSTRSNGNTSTRSTVTHCGAARSCTCLLAPMSASHIRSSHRRVGCGSWRAAGTAAAPPGRFPNGSETASSLKFSSASAQACGVRIRAQPTLATGAWLKTRPRLRAVVAIELAVDELAAMQPITCRLTKHPEMAHTIERDALITVRSVMCSLPDE